MSSFRVFQLNTIEMHETKTKMIHWHFFLKSVLLFSGTKSWQRPNYRSLSYISFYIHCSTSKMYVSRVKYWEKNKAKQLCDIQRPFFINLNLLRFTTEFCINKSIGFSILIPETRGNVFLLVFISSFVSFGVYFHEQYFLMDWQIKFQNIY